MNATSSKTRPVFVSRCRKCLDETPGPELARNALLCNGCAIEAETGTTFLEREPPSTIH